MSLESLTEESPASAAPYRSQPGVFDEMKDASGQVRPHWRALVEAIEQHGLPEMRERKQSAQQLLREHGVTYNVYNEGSSDERPWNLDLLPLVVSAEEWAGLEAGLIQRTRLLNQVLAEASSPVESHL